MKNMRGRFNLVIKNEFDSLYGSDEENIKSFQKLCHILKIDPVPVTAEGCYAVSLLTLWTF
jgi:hypothetical protein